MQSNTFDLMLFYFQFSRIFPSPFESYNSFVTIYRRCKLQNATYFFMLKNSRFRLDRQVQILIMNLRCHLEENSRVRLCLSRINLFDNS